MIAPPSRQQARGVRYSAVSGASMHEAGLICQDPVDNAPSIDQFQMDRQRRRSHLLASVSCRRGAPCVPDADASAAPGRLRGGASTVKLEDRPVPAHLECDDVNVDPINKAVNYCKYLVAGATSAVVSRTCVAPFERVKIDIMLHNTGAGSMDTARQILKTEGVAGFWKGNLLNLMRAAPHKALNFTSYDILSHTLKEFAAARSSPEKMESNTNSARFLAGALAGITATLICFPLDVLRVRMLAPGGSPYGGLRATAAGIWKHEGVGRFYTGIMPAIISIAPTGAVFYGIYDVMKEYSLKQDAAAQGLESHDNLQLGAARTLLFGGVAGACAEVCGYPLEVIRRQMQLMSLGAARQSLGGQAGRVVAASQPGQMLMMFAAASTVFRQEGLLGFYSGVLPSTLQVLPNAALSYFAYENCKELLRAVPLQSDEL